MADNTAVANTAPAPTNPGPVDTLPFTFRTCPICHLSIQISWKEHICSSVRGAAGSHFANVVQTWSRTKAAAATLERLLGQGAAFLPIKDIEIKVNELQNIVEMDQGEIALKELIHGFKKVTEYLSETRDTRNEMLAAHWYVILIRRGYCIELLGPDMLLVQQIPDGDAFLHQYIIALELQSFAFGRRVGDQDPFSMELVSVEHRARRAELEGMGAPFITYREIMSDWELSETFKFLERNQPADILDPPLIRPRWTTPYRLPGIEERMGSGMPVNRRDTIFIQLLLKMKAMLNLISTNQARDVCASRCQVIPEELVRIIQENAVKGLIKTNPRITHAIATGRSLRPFIDTLVSHVRQLMTALEQEPCYERLFSSMFAGVFDHLLYKEVLWDRNRARDELASIRPVLNWLLSHVNERIWRTYCSLIPNPASVTPQMRWKLLGRDMREAFVKNDDQEGMQVSDETMRANLDTMENSKTAVVSVKEFHRFIDNEECPISPLTIHRTRRMSAPDILPDAVYPMLRYPTAERKKKLRRFSFSQPGAEDCELGTAPRLDTSHLEESAHGNSHMQKQKKKVREQFIYDLFAHENFAKGLDASIPDIRVPEDHTRLYFEEFEVEFFEFDDTD